MVRVCTTGVVNVNCSAIYALAEIHTHDTMSLAVHAVVDDNVNCVAVATARVTALVRLVVATTNGVAFGNAVPLKLITPDVAAPPVPTLTLPAHGVDPAVILGDVPNPELTVGNASVFTIDPIVKAAFDAHNSPSADHEKIPRDVDPKLLVFPQNTLVPALTAPVVVIVPLTLSTEVDPFVRMTPVPGPNTVIAVNG